MLKVQKMSFQYNTSKNVLENIDFTLNRGEHLCVMGESGCGKSTLLKVIYGLLDVHKGVLFWDDIEILGPKEHLVPGMDFIKYVAQDFDLMPFISVSENIKKFLSRFYPDEAQQRTEELLEVIEMSDFADVMVKTLSGGQQQRVAIARALAKEPELLLLDEPFSQIDNFKKNSLRRKLFTYLKAQNIACIVATHDGSDALSFADKMLVIRNQHILAHGAPTAIYQQQKDRHVASLFDDVNEITQNGKTQLYYPHQISIVENSEMKGLVVQSYCKGSYWLIEVEFDEQHLFVNSTKELDKNTKIFLAFR